MSTALAYPHAPPRSIGGATVLQIVPSLRDDMNGRSAVAIAYALLEAGARAVVAGAGGRLAADLQSFGAEWLPLPNLAASPLKILSNARALEAVIAAERVDIVHAYGASAAWSALAATAKLPVWLVTTLPDNPYAGPVAGYYRSALGRGDRVIAHSSFAASASIKRHRIPADRVSVIPRSIDTATFDPSIVHPHRVAAVREGWAVAPGERIVLAPSRFARWHGQHVLVEAARLLAEIHTPGLVFVLAGDRTSHAGYAQAVEGSLREQRLGVMFRLPGPCADMPAAFAAADVVVFPATEPPVFARLAAEAQAMARPVIASDIGVLPDAVITPPRMPEELRTGWLVRPGDAADLALALRRILALDASGYRGVAARARQFADFMFSPRNVAATTVGLYTSLLEGNG